MSLKSKLNELIKREGIVSYEAIKSYCETGRFGKYYRITTAERRLRSSESPDIEAVLKDGYIISYKHKNPQQYKVANVLAPDGTVERTIKIAI